MFKKLSLRIKITIITTIIIILVSVILTIVSVFNANNGIYSVMTARDIPNDNRNSSNNSEESKIIDKNSSIEKSEEYHSLPNIYEKANDSNEQSSENIAAVNAIYLFKVNAITYMIIIIIMGSIFIYFILGKLLKPVKKLTVEVGIINENKLSQRVSGFNSGDEVSELANSFNTMLDRLDKAFESQKRFSSDAAHELKTPLTALKTNLDILDMDEKPSDEDYKRTISIFRKQTERMINLVNNLFILSAQKDYDFNDKIEFDVIIEEILQDLDIEIRDKNLNVYFNNSNVSIIGNNTMLIHAISNIVQNAVKYNNIYGSIYISIEEIHKECIIKIRDTGIGIPRDKVEYIFDAFYRADKSRSRKIAGAGLGLAITKNIINSHGGKIAYFPNEEGGSIFEIILPISK